MSKILRRCLSLVLVIMLLASFSLGGTLNASADNKTGDGLAAYAMRAYNEGWAYVWGGASPGAVDCSGLIYSYVEGGERTTEAMLNASPESGYVSNGVPDIPGLGLWQPGHVGVYVGDGMAVDARDEISNVCYQSVATKSWVMWFKVSGVSYGTVSSVTNDNQDDEEIISSDTNNSDTYELEYLSQGASGSDVQALQERLKELGYFEEDTTQYFGPVTEAALTAFQIDAGLTPDGVYNDATKSVLMSNNAPVKFVDTDEDDAIFTDNSQETVNIPAVDGEDISSDILGELSEDTLQGDLSTQPNQEDIVSEEADTDEIAEEESSNKLVYSYDDIDDGVSNIQYILIKLGYYHGDINNVYDEKTFNSVEFFQLDNDLPATGSVDENTLDAMFFAFADKYSQTENDVVEDVVEIEKVEDEQITVYEKETDSDTANELSTDVVAEFKENSDNDKNLTTDIIESVNADPTYGEYVSETSSTDTDSEVNSDKPEVKSTPVKNTANTGDLPKSPRTGDPIVMGIQSAIDYFHNYVNTTLVLIVLGITCIVIFFACTVHYWNVSMEKRKQRAKKATTVSAYRRGSM